MYATAIITYIYVYPPGISFNYRRSTRFADVVRVIRTENVRFGPTSWPYKNENHCLNRWEKFENLFRCLATFGARFTLHKYTPRYFWITVQNSGTKVTCSQQTVRFKPTLWLCKNEDLLLD